MGRLIFFLLLGLAVWWLVRGLSRAKVKQAEKRALDDQLVACARCGVNLPRSSAREEAGRFFCLDNPHCHP